MGGSGGGGVGAKGHDLKASKEDNRLMRGESKGRGLRKIWVDA